MDRNRFILLVASLKRLLRRERRLNRAEFYHLIQLSEAVLDHGRMLQQHYGYASLVAMVEVEELASRFREPPRTMKNVLEFLRDTGHAEPSDRQGLWKLHLARTPGGQANANANANDEKDAGAA